MTRGFGEIPSSTPYRQVNSRVTFNTGNTENDSAVSSSSFVELLSKKVFEELEKTLKLDNTANSSLLNSNGSISIDVHHNENEVYRRYVLNKKTRYETFENYLFTELKSKRLFYVLDQTEREKTDKTKLADDDIKVKDIVINHIHEEYNDRFAHITDPTELIKEIKKIKRQEIGLTKHIAYQNLINIKYDKEKETGFDFCAIFDVTVRIYESHMKGIKYPEDDKRSLFYNAVKRSIPAVVTADCLSETDSTNACDLSKLKNIVL